jgi:hypothetical protein
LHGFHRNDVWEDFFFCDAYLFVKSVHLWEFRDVHGHGDTYDGDWDSDVQEWKHDAGNGHDQQRNCNLQHLDAASGL